MPKSFRVAPLKGSFMITAMLGFLISVIYVWDLNRAYASAFAVVFAIMFIASIVSMSYAPIQENPKKPM